MNEESIKLIAEVVARYGANQESLVEILSDLNAQFGYLTQETIVEVARRLNVPQSHVFSVATFYSMLNVGPTGKHVIKMCEDAPCHLRGGQEVWQALQDALGIKFGETTPDGQWTLQATSCLGLCAVGPVVVVDDEVIGHVTAERIPEILARYRDEPSGGAA